MDDLLQDMIDKRLAETGTIKEGNLLLDKLRQSAKRRNGLAILAIECANYNPPWYYWLDWLKCNSNCFAQQPHFAQNASYLHKKHHHHQVLSANGYLVDSGIKVLVDTLNSNPRIETIESCEGGNGEPAFVDFNYTDSVDGILKFARFLARHFASLSQKSAQLINPAYEVDISLKWCGDKITPFFEICMPSEIINDVTNIFSHVETG